MRSSLCLLASTLALAGCSSLAHQHVAAHGRLAPSVVAPEASPAETEPAAESRRVLVIVVDGLRQSVLDDYLTSLDEADDEPEWPSGLALLRQEGFRFATADRAEASVPGGGLAAAATWATGEWPDTHRVPGSVFYEARPDGRLMYYALDDALDGSRLHYGPALTVPSAESPTLTDILVQTRTWAARLAPTHRVAAVLTPFGHDAEWLIPDPADVGAAGILRTTYGAAATPLLDRETADGVLEMLLNPDIDITIGWFRGVGMDSCVQPGAGCGGSEGGLNGIQRRALVALDGRLAETLGRYLIARPDAFARTSLVFVGTGSGVDRGPRQPDASKLMPPTTLLERVIERATDAPCIERLNAAAERGDLAVAGDGAVARIYVRPGPLGQGHRVRGDLMCLGPAVDALLRDASWMAGVARMPAERFSAPEPRASRFEITLRDDFEKGLSARRKSRLIARIRRSIDDGPAPRSGDIIVFAGNGWVFAEPGRDSLVPDAALGSLEEASMAVPFLIADRNLSDVAQVALRAAAVDLADVAPTVLAMAEAPAEAFADLPRPPVVRWRTEPRRVLEVVAADRRIAQPASDARPRVSFIETDADLTVIMTESTDLWPADEVGLRIGDSVWQWDPDAATFAEGAPCTFAEVDGRRTWSCSAPLDRGAAAIQVAGARRSPSGDDDVDGPMVRLAPIVQGRIYPELSKAEPTCRLPQGVRVGVEASDALGLSLADVFLVDDRIGGPGRVPGSLVAETEVGAIEPSKACAGDALATDCQMSATTRTLAGPVDVPFPSTWLDHHAAARALEGITPVDPDRLRARWSDAGDPGTAPRSAYLAIRVCNVSGRCTRRALVSDVDLATLPACP